MFSNEIFRARLASSRKAIGMTQGQLGEAIGTKKQAVNNWESGRNLPPLDKAFAIADVLDVSLDYLVGRSDDPRRR